MRPNSYAKCRRIFRIRFPGVSVHYSRLRVEERRPQTYSNTPEALRPDSGPCPPLTGLHNYTHDTPQSLELLWTTDQPVAQTSDNIQHPQQTDIHALPGEIRTRDPTKRAASYPRLRTRRHCEMHGFGFLVELPASYSGQTMNYLFICRQFQEM